MSTETTDRSSKRKRRRASQAQASKRVKIDESEASKALIPSSSSAKDETGKEPSAAESNLASAKSNAAKSKSQRRRTGDKDRHGSPAPKWNLSGPLGGRFLHIDPIFSPDEE